MEVFDQNIVALKYSISTDIEERSSVLFFTGLNLKVLDSPQCRSCLYWKTYPKKKLFYLIFDLLVCTYVCFIPLKGCVYLSVRLLFTYSICPSVSLDPTLVFSLKCSAEHKYWSLHTWLGFPFLVYTHWSSSLLKRPVNSSRPVRPLDF